MERRGFTRQELDGPKTPTGYPMVEVAHDSDMKVHELPRNPLGKGALKRFARWEKTHNH